MWFVTRDILKYICNEDIAEQKRIRVIKYHKEKIASLLTDLGADELISMLFNSKVLRDVKLIICDVIDGLAEKYDDNSKTKVKILLRKFKESGHYKERYILSDTCPNVFKKNVIETIYSDSPYDIVKKGKVSKKIKKVILRLCLSRHQLERLLDRDISHDLKLYIVDECFTSDYDLISALGNDKVPKEFKERILSNRVDGKNLFKFLDSADSETRDYVLSVKSKEFDKYLNSLNVKNVLKVMNDFSTPKYLLEYILKYKKDVVEAAIDKASSGVLHDVIWLERNTNLLKIVFERRKETVYRILDKLFEYELLYFLKLTYLPKEYKDYIITKRRWALNFYLSRIDVWDAINILKQDNSIPEEVKEYVYNKYKNRIINYYSKEDDKGVVKIFRYNKFYTPLKKILVQERVNKNNIMDILGEYFIDKETVDLVVENKKEILSEILMSQSNDKLFKGKLDGLSSEVVESLYCGNELPLQERINLLTEDDIYSYLTESRVVNVVKKLMLEKLGIDRDNSRDVLLLINTHDAKLVVDNYEDIKSLVYGLGIDFNSFLQYGSGSKKYSKWFDSLLSVISNDDIGDFAVCKDYLFKNYYVDSSENSVYMINSFLEFLHNYGQYKELFLSFVKDNVKLTKEDKENLRFVMNISGMSSADIPKNLDDLSRFKLELYKNYIDRIQRPYSDIALFQRIFNDILFCNANSILSNIGGTGALRTLKKDNINSPAVVELIDELMLCSSVIEMVNYTDNEEGLRKVLTYIFSDISLLSRIQNIFANFEEKVRKVYELDSMNNLTTLDDARKNGMYNYDLSNLYGGEVFDFSDKNYCLYGHILSSKENINDVINGISTGNSNFISVSPVSYRGQKYYYDKNDVVVAYDKVPKGSFICSSIANMGTNYIVKANSSEVGDFSRSQRGILETSAVVKQNAEALLFREGLKPCGLILPGGREPSKRELEYHEKYGLPFIITQPMCQSIENPTYAFVNGLDFDGISTDISELSSIIEMLRPNVCHIKDSPIYTGREVAVFADCHSMYEPTLVVLEDIRRKGITEIYSLGDNVGIGPNPVEVFDLLDEFGVQSVSGNAEYYNTLGTDAFPYLDEARLDSQLWTERKLGPERIKNLNLYPASRDILIGDKKIALCHFANDIRWDFRERNVYGYASKNGSNVEQLRYTNSEEALKKITNCIVSNKGNVSAVKGYMSSKEEPIFGGKKVTDYDYVLQGHYHFELFDVLDDTEVYTLRAVGMGYEGTDKDNEACYYVIKERKDGDIDIEKVYVPFNRNALLSSIRTCDLPSKERVLSYVKKSR